MIIRPFSYTCGRLLRNIPHMNTNSNSGHDQNIWCLSIQRPCKIKVFESWPKGVLVKLVKLSKSLEWLKHHELYHTLTPWNIFDATQMNPEIFHSLTWWDIYNTKKKKSWNISQFNSYILKTGFAGSQKPQKNLNFPQKDCLRMRKL